MSSCGCRRLGEKMIIVYEGNDEVLICTQEMEYQLIADYFSNSDDRDREDYDRSTIADDMLSVSSAGLTVG